MQIDLATLVGAKNAVLAGVDRGEAARAEFELDRLDASDEDISIVAPEKLEAISPSFVQGFLYGSFNALGEEGLLAKYKFLMDDLLIDDIKAGIARLRMKRRIAGHTGSE